jgi:hypothetical protein
MPGGGRAKQGRKLPRTYATVLPKGWLDHRWVEAYCIQLDDNGNEIISTAAIEGTGFADWIRAHHYPTMTQAQFRAGMRRLCIDKGPGYKRSPLREDLHARLVARIQQFGRKPWVGSNGQDNGGATAASSAAVSVAQSTHTSATTAAMSPAVSRGASDGRTVGVQPSHAVAFASSCASAASTVGAAASRGVSDGRAFGDQRGHAVAVAASRAGVASGAGIASGVGPAPRGWATQYMSPTTQYMTPATIVSASVAGVVHTVSPVASHEMPRGPPVGYGGGAPDHLRHVQSTPLHPLMAMGTAGPRTTTRKSPQSNVEGPPRSFPRLGSSPAVTAHSLSTNSNSAMPPPPAGWWYPTHPGFETRYHPHPHPHPQPHPHNNIRSGSDVVPFFQVQGQGMLPQHAQPFGNVEQQHVAPPPPPPPSSNWVQQIQAASMPTAHTAAAVRTPQGLVPYVAVPEQTTQEIQKPSASGNDNGAQAGTAAAASSFSDAELSNFIDCDILDVLAEDHLHLFGTAAAAAAASATKGSSTRDNEDDDSVNV